MQYQNCPLCRQNNTEIIFRKGDLNKDLINVICKNCALIYINPRPSLEEYEEFHKATFLREGHNLTHISQFKSKLKSDFEMKSKAYEFLKEFINSQSNVLDIGCGFGTLLGIIRKDKKCGVEGIELSDLDVRAAKEYYNLDILNVNFDIFAEQEKNKNKFDLIILHHTFEHFPDPVEKLKKMKQVLKPSGKLFIGVPNIMNIKKRPEIFFQIGHPFSYSPYTLKKMLEMEGFKIIKFNNRGAFPGGMDAIVSLGESGIELERGKDHKGVIQYIKSVNTKFIRLRKLRSALLFWLPKNLRIKATRFIYKILKKI